MHAFLLIGAILAVASAAPSSDSNRIVGGSDASPGQFPMMCSLQWGQTVATANWFACGSTIINENWLMTAAHCITEAWEGGILAALCGITNFDAGETTGQRRGLAETVIHPGWIWGPNVNPHDIAVLRLDAPLSFNAFVQPITLPVANVVPTGSVIAAGWGSTSLTTDPNMPANLQFLPKTIISMNTCATWWAHEDALYINSNVCTGPVVSGVATCGGDSGGPILQGNTQVGVVSWGVFPCGIAAPSVHAQVSFYRDWIDSHVN